MGPVDRTAGARGAARRTRGVATDAVGGEPAGQPRAHRLGWTAVSKRRKNSPSPEAPRRQKLRDVFVPRPFAGLVDEPEWIALRELVPAASVPLRLAPALVEQY